MAKTKISQFDAVASNNTDINSVNVAEGCPPSGINNAIREMASLLKKQEVGTDAMTSPDIDGGTIDGATIGGSSGVTIGVSDGTVSAPSIKFTGDTNTGIYRGGTDILKFVTAGTDAVTIDASQDVTLAGSLNFADNEKAIFGAGDDLQIYHNGTDSKIYDGGTGNLTLESNGTQIELKSSTGDMVRAVKDSEVVLFHSGSRKLATTSTGIDVTGTATMDGLTVDGSAQINTGSGVASELIFTSNGQAGRQSKLSVGTDRSVTLTAGVGAVNETPDMTFKTGTASGEKTRLHIEGSTGDISFYEDTGTTPKLFWDASEERLGIGHSSPNVTLHIQGANASSGDSNHNVVIDDTTSMAQGVGGGIVFRGNYGSGLTNGGFIQTEKSNATSGNYAFDLVLGSRANGSSPAERMRITSDGNVGIGTSSPLRQLSISNASNAEISFISGTSSNASILFGDGITGTDVYRGYIQYQHPIDSMIFATSAIERMRIDSSGNLLVGKSTADFNTAGIELRANNDVTITQSGAACLFLNRLSTDGEILNLRKDGATVGSIGNTSGQSYFYIVNDGGCGIAFGNTNAFPANGTGSLIDNAKDLGGGATRWDDVYATNGTIQTSDRNEKQDIEELSEAEQRVAVVAKGLMRKFRWIDSVAEKGDNARTHFGVIAQDLQDAFTAEGLDASKYAMFTSNTWWEKEISVDAVEADEENGIEAKDAYTYIDTKEEATEGYTERTRLGVRYNQLLAFIISAI